VEFGRTPHDSRAVHRDTRRIPAAAYRPAPRAAKETHSLARLAPKLDHIASVSLVFRPPEVVGEAPDGLRLTFVVDSGVVAGPRLNGQVLARTVDHMIVRRDGVGEVRVQGTIRTSEGAMLSTSYCGVCDFGADGYRTVRDGKIPAVVHVELAPRFLTGHAAYRWMNRAQFVGVGDVRVGVLIANYDLFLVDLGQQDC
jgi:hypothetical protein